MDKIRERPSVRRVSDALARAGVDAEVVVLAQTSRSAADAAAALGIDTGQIASSIVFQLPDGHPLLVITSGRHRVDTVMVGHLLGVGLSRADAEFVKTWSGFSIGGVSPVGWAPEHSRGTDERGVPTELTILIDEALAGYDVVWAAAGHPHAVFATNFEQLVSLTGARAAVVAAPGSSVE
jgi:prolyl-tRNA editing enzyme YbaK/EbsC (Cys-tRNA(Pro) deacylase)